ncbi:MAG: hypothetical protein A2X64_06420 [Ignavibacteria bacterium GWF2_33_9]|nr:MAG: hypothetical protein A2X64_06420 [Ignavibacteria bacterium GWF2_33_9]
MNLSTIDIIVVSVYFLLILFIGFKAKSKKVNFSEENFILAGRKLTLPFFIASLVATWYGNILGIGEFIYNSGIVAWICFGIPYYISALLFSLFFSKKIRNLGYSSIPEQITGKFGKKAGFISSIIILLITLPAAYLLMLGVIFQIFSGISLELSIIISAILSLIYLFWGGLKADIWTNSVQFVLMYIGFGVLLIFSFLKLGDLSDMFAKLPASHLTITGGNSIQYVLTWFIISLQTFVDPSFHQRCAASKDSNFAKQGILISILFWILFDTLTLLTGLYAKAFLNLADPLQAYPILADMVLPIFWKGIFLTAVLSVIMSTLDSYAFVSAITIGKDIFSSFKKFNEIETVRNIRIGLLLTTILSIIIAILIPSAIDIIYKTSSIAIPGLFFPIILSYSSKYGFKKGMTVWSMIIPSAISFIWTLLSMLPNPYLYIFQEIEPMFPGILISLLFGIFTVKKNIKVYDVKNI